MPDAWTLDARRSRLPVQEIRGPTILLPSRYWSRWEEVKEKLLIAFNGRIAERRMITNSTPSEALKKKDNQHIRCGNFTKEILSSEEIFGRSWCGIDLGRILYQTDLVHDQVDCSEPVKNCRKSGVYIAQNCRAFDATWLLFSRCIVNLANKI